LSRPIAIISFVAARLQMSLVITETYTCKPHYTMELAALFGGVPR